MKSCGCRKPDRYISFEGIDCDGQARLVMQQIDKCLAVPERRNAFWEYFQEKRSGIKGPKYDDLYMIHSSIQQVRELFEEYGDREDIDRLQKIEEECC